MALTEEDLSAMLQPSHPSEGLMSMSLANAMLNSSIAMDPSSRDFFSAQLPYSPLQRANSMGGAAMNMNLRGVPERSSGISSMGSLGSGSSASSMSQWPSFSSDEKWELEGKSEVLDRASGASYGQAQPLQPLNRTQGLQRYHSAPSSFLQCLADFGEEDFSHITNPLGDSSTGRDVVDGQLNYFNENLAPIMESAPSRWGNKQPEKLVVARSTPMNSTEQYFAIQAEIAGQSAAVGAPEANTRLGAAASRALKSSLLRQSSSPAELLAAISNQSEDDLNPIRSQDDTNARVPLFSNPTYAFNDAVTGAGGVWKMPASNNLFAGKRVRFPEEMTDDSTSDLLLGDDHNRRTGTLTRHQSLPSTSTTVSLGGDGPNLSTDLGYDDLLDLYAPCKTRARRGYATHPRSIAERNRRSRISERMKKLQDLVPNMDKQTNTADMLDEAVEYVKHLQGQVKDLSETIIRLKNGIQQHQQQNS